MNEHANGRRTPLYDEHLALGARMVPFAGFSMPVQYADGALKEYETVRGDGAGLFDISHMGQIRVTGADALAFLQYATTNDVAALADGQVQYSALLNDDGGFIDDITVYRLGACEYYLCVNAANRARDVAHLQRLADGFDACVADESDATTLLALQGAAAERLLQPLTGADLPRLGYYRFVHADLPGADAIISRTGYTGEDGFELYLPNDAAVTVWRALLDAGARPVGLAARDMLRTEMGYALYGHEISAGITPVEARLMWIVKPEKGDFVGREAVLARKEEGPRQRLIALELTDRGIPREGYPVLDASGRRVGEVTSGLFSPMRGQGVALARVSPECAPESGLAVEIRGRAVQARLARLPFVRSRVRR